MTLYSASWSNIRQLRPIENFLTKMMENLYSTDNKRKAARKVVDLFLQVSLNDFLSNDVYGKKVSLLFFYGQLKIGIFLIKRYVNKMYKIYRVVDDYCVEYSSMST